VIGNNNYKHLKKLKNAGKDACAIKKILENQYSYKEVKLLIDATRWDVTNAIGQFRKKLGIRDNLLIYYAGHGWLDEDADSGYWLPVDAEPNNKANWISEFDITGEIKAIESKHIIVISDSCYAGKLTRGVFVEVKRPAPYDSLIKKRSRTVIVSGGLEPVIDNGGQNGHSVFASAFLEALYENKKLIAGDELFVKIRNKVKQKPVDQTPEYSKISKAGDNGGQFIFVRKRES